MALFAYNPGVKSPEAAKIKALVRYGPAEGTRRHRHLLDLARLSLVFASSDLLLAGLETMTGQFEVVDVRNSFRLPSKSGLRMVEVLLIVEVDMEDGRPPTPFVCEVRLEEHSFWKARQRAEVHLNELMSHMSKHYSSAVRVPGTVEYVARWSLDSPADSHNCRIMRRHCVRHFGSSVGAWRRAFGNNRLVSFSQFRDICKELKCREHATEYWQELDSGRGGCVSLFELDPEAVALLEKLFCRVLALCDVKSPDDIDIDSMWQRLTFCVRPQKEGRLEIQEWRAVLKPLGLRTEEANALFNSLDAGGGNHLNPPAHITVADIRWLKNIPALLDLEAVNLISPGGVSESEALRFVTWRSSLRSTPGSGYAGDAAEDESEQELEADSHVQPVVTIDPSADFFETLDGSPDSSPAQSPTGHFAGNQASHDNLQLHQEVAGSSRGSINAVSNRGSISAASNRGSISAAPVQRNSLTSSAAFAPQPRQSLTSAGAAPVETATEVSPEPEAAPAQPRQSLTAASRQMIEAAAVQDKVEVVAEPAQNQLTPEELEQKELEDAGILLDEEELVGEAQPSPEELQRQELEAAGIVLDEGNDLEDLGIIDDEGPPVQNLEETNESEEYDAGAEAGQLEFDGEEEETF
eukprot:TRINITY_DN93614_c0_g1_i1.p1 TRINITY_DN93614_c0_g1~~TRINITY_DN93614_c0_g1_i1.p1  ORF type:complete len:736 (+),score=171.92 TRINITY_DN93614_c0_g1_i1:298-2208(+)